MGFLNAEKGVKGVVDQRVRTDQNEVVPFKYQLQHAGR